MTSAPGLLSLNDVSGDHPVNEWKRRVGVACCCFQSDRVPAYRDHAGRAKDPGRLHCNHPYRTGRAEHEDGLARG